MPCVDNMGTPSRLHHKPWFEFVAMRHHPRKIVAFEVISLTICRVLPVAVRVPRTTAPRPWTPSLMRGPTNAARSGIPLDAATKGSNRCSRLESVTTDRVFVPALPIRPAARSEGAGAPEGTMHGLPEFSPDSERVPARIHATMREPGTGDSPAGPRVRPSDAEPDPEVPLRCPSAPRMFPPEPPSRTASRRCDPPGAAWKGGGR